MFSIRAMKREDMDEVLGMMKVFYASPAVLHKAPETVLRRDIEDCIGDMPYIEGYVFTEREEYRTEGLHNPEEPHNAKEPLNPEEPHNAEGPHNPEEPHNAEKLLNPEEPHNAEGPLNPEEPHNEEKPLNASGGDICGKTERIAGYAMVAKGYSTEYGGLCLWVEDIYMKPQYRHKGLGSQFFSYLEKQYEGRAVRYRLEVEEENQRAVEAYRKNGYHILPYMEMTKEI